MSRWMDSLVYCFISFRIVSFCLFMLRLTCRSHWWPEIDNTCGAMCVLFVFGVVIVMGQWKISICRDIKCKPNLIVSSTLEMPMKRFSCLLFLFWIEPVSIRWKLWTNEAKRLLTIFVGWEWKTWNFQWTFLRVCNERKPICTVVHRTDPIIITTSWIKSYTNDSLTHIASGLILHSMYL